METKVSDGKRGGLERGPQGDVPNLDAVGGAFGPLDSEIDLVRLKDERGQGSSRYIRHDTCISDIAWSDLAPRLLLPPLF